MQNKTISEARELLAFSAQYLESLSTARGRLIAAPEKAPEQSWLSAACERVSAARGEVQAALAGAIALPEFEAERQAARQAAYGEWVDAVQALHTGISFHVGPGNPLIEVLFPDQKFDKLRKGGVHGRAYQAEFERRRALAYVVRLSGEPEYDFMPPLLARVDAARANLEQHDAPSELGEAELDALRASVQDASDALELTLAQARLLGEAAFLDRPGLSNELGLDLKPKRRSLRPAPIRKPEPEAAEPEAVTTESAADADNPAAPDPTFEGPPVTGEHAFEGPLDSELDPAQGPPDGEIDADEAPDSYD